MTTDISIVRWDPTLQQEIVEDYEYDGGNSSSRLFERSRIKALAGELFLSFYTFRFEGYINGCINLILIFLIITIINFKLHSNIVDRK